MTRAVVVNLGLPKTGTTTLARALRRAGYRTADWKIRPRQTPRTELHDAFVARILYEDYFASGDPLARLGGFSAITEMSAMVPPDHVLWPQTDWGLIDAIRRHHPQARFLLSHRAAALTADSMVRWRNLGSQRLPKHGVPGLPAGFGHARGELARWIDAHAAFVRRVFAGDPALLEFDVGDPGAPAAIGAHLGCSLPWWGHANRTAPGAGDGTGAGAACTSTC
ncbi:sulfotransferase [Roseivivax isoporae]|uniref:Sulfotransferase family protein n=1 Tax=Roseivivax isoporae LMG 25204 TaxID=1449351 RepID=X7F877_9RHOB|nr:sulfotransferase [Roseivivax isoporae]ETX28306.1 hypothetical protein RISW2_08395 [Roseivivax isoporae LMG 25204]